MVDWARWRHKYNTTAHTRERNFLLGPGAEDCAPTPLASSKYFADQLQEFQVLYLLEIDRYDFFEADTFGHSWTDSRYFENFQILFSASLSKT